MSATNGTPTLTNATVTPEGHRALWGAAIGYAMDGFDLLILGFMLRQMGHDLNLNPAQAASLVTVTLIGAVIGGLVFGLLSDRLGRIRVLTWTIVVFAVFTGLCAFAHGYWDLLVVTYSLLTNAIALLLTGAIMGFSVNGMLGGYGALMSELYPTHVRATAQNVLFNLGRAVGGLGPVAVGAVTLWWGFPAAIGLLALLYLLDLVVLLLFIPERRGEELH